MGANRTAPRESFGDIRRATRRQYSAEEKIRIVLEGLRGEVSIAELCRKEAHRPEHVLRLVEGVPRRPASAVSPVIPPAR